MRRSDFFAGFDYSRCLSLTSHLVVVIDKPLNKRPFPLSFQGKKGKFQFQRTVDISAHLTCILLKMKRL